MDNGLIFPYRQNSDPDEVRDANHPKPPVNPCFLFGGGVGLVVERGTRPGSSQAMG
jgi:hypothetical protein